MLELYENIRRIRRAKKMSQAELAKRVGYTDRSSIAKIEKGDVDLPQSKIILFAKALGVTAGELMGNTGIDMPRTLRPDESNLLDDYNVLSDIGKNKVTTYTKNLRDVEEAEAFVNAAHERNDIDATEEMFQNDEDIMNDENF